MLEVPTDPVEAAQVAGLRYVSDQVPGIRRVRRGKGFSYRDPRGEPVKDEKTLARIKRLVIPPAWQDVWICPSPNGHLQATGRDAKGRKQYRYHSKWREVRDETKYGKMIAFGEALPKIRKRVEADLSLRGLPKDKVLAAIVRLLETTLIRIGNDEYASTNKSYGLTTMRKRHVDVFGSSITFDFRGKRGVHHHIDLRDKRLARIVRRCKELPGYELFKYVDEEGERRSVGSADVNAYLKEITGEDFTAKDFRTWAGTVLATVALQEFEACDSEAQAKRNVVQAVERVAKRLGNTPAICRKCYIHPDVIASYLSGSLKEVLTQRVDKVLKDDLADLSPEEAAVLAFLRARFSENEAR